MRIVSAGKLFNMGIGEVIGVANKGEDNPVAEFKLLEEDMLEVKFYSQKGELVSIDRTGIEIEEIEIEEEGDTEVHPEPSIAENGI